MQFSSAPFEMIDGPAQAGLLLICDHASAHIPPAMQTLGLPPELRHSHVVWDIGAAHVTRLLAGLLACPAILSGVSRLVIDCNRPPGGCGSMPANSCGIDVPGNHHLTDQDKAQRIHRWFAPYHRQIDQTIDHMTQTGATPAIISIHSFTPVMDGFARPWHVGLLWNRDSRLLHPAKAALSAIGGMVVGDNQPYSGQVLNYSLDRQAGLRDLPHLSFEIRQDLVADDAGCHLWANHLAQTLRQILPAPSHASETLEPMAAPLYGLAAR